MANLILEAIADEPPLNIADGGAIRAGFHPELDELRDLSQNGKQYIARIEARERQRTGIGSLKVRFNNVFGYYIEITRANLQLAPADYERKQTLANAERFTTPELKDYERKVLDAEDKIQTLEKELFADLRKRVAAQAQRVRSTASAVGELDVTAALAQVAAENRYHRPSFSPAGEMRIMAGRHPVIERMADRDAGRFIPNDLYLNNSTDLIAIITGPNMGGKSTYLRQAALIAIMAQMGGFVPAEIGHAAADRPRVHAHRRLRQPVARAFHFHGGDDRDGGDPQHRDRRAASSCWTRSAAAPPLTTAWRWRGRWWSTSTRAPAPRRCSPRTTTN